MYIQKIKMEDIVVEYKKDEDDDHKSEHEDLGMAFDVNDSWTDEFKGKSQRRKPPIIESDEDEDENTNDKKDEESEEIYCICRSSDISRFMM